MSSLVFSDIIASRDTISIGIVLKLQNVLGVEVLTKKAVMDAASRYVEYVFQKDNWWRLIHSLAKTIFTITTSTIQRLVSSTKGLLNLIAQSADVANQNN